MPTSSRYLYLSLFLALAAAPLLAGLVYATLYGFGLVGILSGGFTWQYAASVLSAGAFWSSLGFSLYVATVSMALSISLALFLAIRLRESLARGFFSYLIYLPLALPAMVVAFFSFQFLSRAGFLSRISYHLGLIDQLEAFPNWVNDPWGVSIIFSHTLMATPFLTILFANLYQNERLDDFSQLAATLGARPRQIARRVSVPILLQKAFATLALYFVFVLGSYEIPLLLGSQSPQMVSVLTINKLQKFNLLDKPEAYIISLFYCLMVLSLLLGLARTGLLTNRAET